MHDIERELIEATGYKARQKYANRQDYLKSILNAVAKLTDDDFDALTDETAFWVNAAVEAHNSKNEEIADFDELDPLAEAEAEGEIEDDADEGSNIDPETGEVLEDDENEVEDDDPETEDEEAEEIEDEIEEQPVVKILKEKPKRTPRKIDKFAKQVPSPERKKPQKSAPNRIHPLHSDEDVVLDKWGCMEGSKNSKALALFEKGATAAEIKQKIGGTYYNILGRCVANGHKMEKEGHIIKLTHKDQAGKKAPTKAAPVKKKAK